MSFTSERLVVKNILNSHQVGEFTTEEETSKVTTFLEYIIQNGIERQMV